MLQESAQLAHDHAGLQAQLTQAQQQAESAQADIAAAQQRASKAEAALQAGIAKAAAQEAERERLRQALTVAQTQARAVPPDLV